jgi:hypothetical protein
MNRSLAHAEKSCHAGENTCHVGEKTCLKVASVRKHARHRGGAHMDAARSEWTIKGGAEWTIKGGAEWTIKGGAAVAVGIWAEPTSRFLQIGMQMHGGL